jgi:hypothetical protein
MAAGHWEGCRGTVWYALATLQVATSEPGGSLKINKYIIENLPQVVGKSLASIWELIDGLWCGNLGLWGNENFWINLNLSILPGFRIMERGDDWNSPMSSIREWAEKGPI